MLSWQLWCTVAGGRQEGHAVLGRVAKKLQPEQNATECKRSHLQVPTCIHAFLFINQKELVRNDLVCKNTQTADDKCA